MLRKRFAIFATCATFPTAMAQTPPITNVPPTQPRVRVVPPSEAVSPRALPGSIVNAPLVEKLIPMDPKSIRVQRIDGQWQLWANEKLFRSFGDRAEDANDVARTLRELYAQQWGQIGTERTVVEYGLTLNNEQKLVAPQIAGFARNVIAWDAKTLRIERVRGMWCLRDDANLLLNFGTHREDADQTLAVIRKYNFNRLGTVGKKETVFTFLTGAPEGLPNPPSILPAAAIFQMNEDAMARTGIPVPQLGYLGEMIKIDPRKVELRTERGEQLLASGNEILARFGNDDWAAREALRLVRDAHLTEFCKYGTAGVTFFLSNGKAPKNLPLHTLGPRFDPAGLRVREVGGKVWLTDATGRQLLPAGSQKEAEELAKLIRAFGFDQLCNVNSGTKATMTILAKAR